MKKINSITSLQQLFKRSQLAIFILTFTICTIIFAVISTYTMEIYANRNLHILSEALGERIQPAVVFKDQITIAQILAEYSEQYPIRSIQVLDNQNRSLAQVKHPESPTFSSQVVLDHLFFNQPATINIQHDQENYGKLIVYGNSSALVSFFYKLLLGLALGFLMMLAVLFWSVSTLYQHLMRSLQPIVETAQMISEEKNYQLRLADSDIQEFQELNIAFNELLEKIHTSSQQLQTENIKLSHQAHHDELTQLPNRHYFYQTLFNLFDSKHREHIALFFIDNNNFKDINDQYGHLAGDAVLQEMAKRLKSNLRQHDFITRLGGDEFAIIVHNIQQPQQLASICEHLLSCSKAPLIFEKAEIHFSFSIGIAFAKNAASPEELITQADSAMYRAKTLPHHWFISPNLNNT